MAQSAPGDERVRLADLEWLDLSELVRLDEDWRHTLVIIARLHFGVSAVLALVVIVYTLLTNPAPSTSEIGAIVGILACVCGIAYFGLTPQEEEARLLRNFRLVVLISILAISLMVYLLRDLQGDYYLLYLLPLVSAAGYLGFTGGLAAGVISSIAYAAAFWFSPFALTPGSFSVLALRALIFVLIASLLGLIAERHLSLLNALRASHKQAIQLAVTDTKTGLYNQAFMQARLPSELSRAERSQTPVAFLMLSVAGLKEIEREHGLAAEDVALRTVGQAIQEQLRATDMASRWGPDEFGVLLYNSDAKGAQVMAHRLAEDLAGHPPADPVSASPLKLSIFHGVAAYPAQTQDKSGTELVQHAYKDLRQS